MKKPEVYILHFTQNGEDIKYYYVLITHGEDEGLYDFTLFYNRYGYEDQRQYSTSSFPTTQEDILHAFKILGIKADTKELIETEVIYIPELAISYF